MWGSSPNYTNPHWGVEDISALRTVFLVVTVRRHPFGNIYTQQLYKCMTVQ